jgi:hypothetical protein
VDIVAFDQEPDPNRNPECIARTWGPVQKAPATVAADYPDRALLLIWPPVNDPTARQALQSYRGDTVAFIGGAAWFPEDDSDSTSHPVWSSMGIRPLLDEKWESVHSVDLPCWKGIHHGLDVYRRRP